MTTSYNHLGAEERGAITRDLSNNGQQAKAESVCVPPPLAITKQDFVAECHPEFDQVTDASATRIARLSEYLSLNPPNPSKPFSLGGVPCTVIVRAQPSASQRKYGAQKCCADAVPICEQPVGPTDQQRRRAHHQALGAQVQDFQAEPLAQRRGVCRPIIQCDEVLPSSGTRLGRLHALSDPGVDQQNFPGRLAGLRRHLEPGFAQGFACNGLHPQFAFSGQSAVLVRTSQPVSGVPRVAGAAHHSHDLRFKISDADQPGISHLRRYSRNLLAAFRRFFYSGRSAVVCWALLLALPSLCMAQQRPPGDVEQLQNVMQQRLQLEQERLLRDDGNWKGGSELMPSPTAPPLVGKSSETPCRTISEVVINGNTRLDLSDIQVGYQGRCLTVVDIERLLSELTQRYFHAGFVTTRVYMPPQDLTQGKLLVDVVEGKIEKIEIKDGSSKGVNLFMTFPSGAGDILSLRDLEQGMDQINSLQSNRASMQLVPSDKEGQSVVVIENKPTLPLHLGISVDNTGQVATGKDQYGVSLAVDNPLGLGDGFSAFIQSSDPERYDSGFSSSGSYVYTLPFGYSTLSAGYVSNMYRRDVVLPSESHYLSNGSGRNYFLRLGHLVYRDRLWKLNLSSTLTKKEQRNYFAGVLLSASSPDLAILDLDISATRFIPGRGAVVMGFGVSQGTSLLGATRNGIGGDEAQAQFLKYRGSLLVNMGGELWKLPVSWTGLTSIQMSDNILYGGEQISAMGVSTVRGFKENYLSGASGLYSRNDFSLQLPSLIESIPVATRVYLGLDYGQVFTQNTSVNRTGWAMGGTLGVALTYDKASLNLSVSSPLRTPPEMLHEKPSFYAKLNYQF